MEDISSALDPDELMDLDEPEPYDLDDDDDDIPDESAASPFQQHLSSGPASAATSAASSPPMDDFPPPFNFTGKPLTIKRGRGRPRREGGKPAPRRAGGSGVPRVRRTRPFGLPRCRGSRSVRQPDRMDFELPLISPSSLDDMSLPDSDGFYFPERERPSIPALEELPYALETWPGKVCAFCNLGERSQLGQGEMMRLNCPEGFTPQRLSTNELHNQIVPAVPEKDAGDKSPRGPVTCRRLKNFSRARNVASNNDYIEELSIIGHTDPPSISLLYEPTGQFYVHRSCALWSHGVNRTENQVLENVGPVVLKSSSKKCSFCNHYGASLKCKSEGCVKAYHFPCATASGALQELSSLSVFCSNHLGDAAMRGEVSVCYTCKVIGDVANLMFCSSCGTHYHGTCVGLAQLPGVRAGWQCRKCRMCQVCRILGDENKLMTCEQCDKVYHASCQRPAVTSIPKYGWKCKCCRICGDCGSRTPGAGLSSRWHLHYTVCDSCYQQRNKGCCCPICQRAYRSHAHREMVQCTGCRKFVHGSCDPEADVATYQQKKDMNPDYEYVCSICKTQLPSRQITCKRSSTDDPGDFSASQESLYDDMSEFDSLPVEESFRSIGLGKGKPFASKIGKKRLTYSTGKPGRPKGSYGKGIPGKQSFMKRQRLGEFGRKRGPKAKMRGVFGAPGVGLSRPVADGKNDDEPGVENRLVLCSAKDKFVLTQDICVMCGALGTDQEGCLISCVQCGQCYHPYCINVKVTKVILQKGWRCLDCTVCEGCGQRNDEGRLLLCDDCDVSYHTYCMDPPLDYVPHGNWKCKWCACCQTCGSTDPGFNCTWMNGCTECGPCASHVTCPSCGEPYSEGDLIIQCVQCERWLHGPCDHIKTDQDAERCAEEGYYCLLCRPRDVPPPHLVLPSVPAKPPTPTKSPEARSNANFFIDGVCLSESGNSLIKSLSMEYHGTRKKRKKLPTVQDKEAGIMATIESVVAGGNAGENTLEDTKLELVDLKDEPQEMYKEGMIWTKEDGPPPEGFTIFTLESGISLLRRKRQRNLQKLGIGGFLVRMRGTKGGQDNDDIDTLPGQTTPTGTDSPMTLTSLGGDADKPRKKPIRRKVKSKLSDTFPAYLQEAFFGKELMDITDTKKMDSGSSEDEKDDKYGMKLPTDELMSMDQTKTEKQVDESGTDKDQEMLDLDKDSKTNIIKDEEDDNTEDLKDVLALSGDLLDPELVNSFINEDDDDLAKNTVLEALGDEGELSQTLGSTENSKDAKDELSDILGSHFNLESIPNINSKDVEDIFKGVLTDESQESQLSQETNIFPTIQSNSQQIFPGTSSQPSPVSIPQMPLTSGAVRPTALPGVQHVSFPPSPYHSDFSNSPQFSEPPSPWVAMNDTSEIDSTSVGVPSTYNQRSSEKMKADEGLGSGATISAVLYANMNHPEWKTEYQAWPDRYKQILKKWRTLTQEQKAPYLQQARDNRSQLRMKKQQQSQTSNKDSSTPSPTTGAKPPAPPVPALTTSLPPAGMTSSAQAPPSEDQEKIVQQQKSAREAEQERQWKQLQAMRQQQAQQQQHVLQEQRVQAIARVQRVQEPPGFIQNNQTSPLQVATNSQEPSPVASPSPVSWQFVGMKSPPFAHPSPQPTNIRNSTPSQSPVHEFPQQSQPSQVAEPLNPDYNQGNPPPKPSQYVKVGLPPSNEQFQQQKPQFPNVRAPIQVRPDQPEVTRQLRDLLQRQQQMKNFDMNQEKAAPRTPECDIPSSSNASGTDTTFRQPLPPGAVRPRIPLSAGPRPLNMRMQQLDGRLQGLDPRTRLILQHQRLVTPLVQQNPNHPLRYAALPTNRPATIDQYEQLLHQRQNVPGRGPPFEQAAPRMPLVQSPGGVVQRPPLAIQSSTISGTVLNQGDSASEQEIPDNVTAELEKLEQETGTMAELQGVSEILGGLGDEDDELLAEMGADFNILEYADPELEALAGEKTNILDLDLEEDHLRQERKKEAQQQQKQAITTSESSTTPSIPVTNNTETTKTESAPPSAPVKAIKEPLPAEPTPQLQNEGLLQQHPPVPHLPPVQQQQQQTPPIAKPQTNPASPTVQQAPPTPQSRLSFTAQQIHQQMLQQVGCKMSRYVQQAAADGRPMPPGAKLQTPEGIVGIVLPNNNVQLQIPQNLQQRLLLQLQNQKLQMKVGQQQNPRMMTPNVNQPQHPGIPAPSVRPRMGLAGPPQPPPPPYPGPPPPYPGNVIPQQQGLQDQPLLIQELLEQEKREQEKQHQAQPNAGEISNKAPTSESDLLSHHDFERIAADVFNTTPGLPPSNQVAANTSALPHWPQQNRIPPAPATQTTTEITTKVQMFNTNLTPAPPLPPETIASEQDKNAQMKYEQWLNRQHNELQQQLHYYETEVQKLRKSRKSLNSRQRQLRKSGNQLTEADSNELQRIASEQAILQKHLESSRKQTRQHGMLIQEYRNRQQPKVSTTSGAPSPLGPPASSPIHHQSPQHSSPMNSPGPVVPHSPGPGSVAALLQSPGGNVSPMQPCRIGTPLSQGEGSPGPVQSPSQMGLHPPVPRMTSPQHRRVVTSPVGYTNEMRASVSQMSQMRFVRASMDHSALQQRIRSQTPSPMQGFSPKPGTPSPLNSPPINPVQLAQQQILQKQFQQQEVVQSDGNILHSARVAQLIQHRNLTRQQGQQPLTPQQHQILVQQQLAKQQQQQQQAAMQLQARLNQQQQQQVNPPQSPMPPKSPLHVQQIMSPHSMPASPMPPKSPMLSFSSNQSNLPHSPASRSPFQQNQPPSSPMMHQYQPPSSPMINSPHGMRRPPSASSSPAMPERPTSVENLSTPRTPYSIEGHIQDNMHTGGGNPNNPNNPLPLPPPGFGKFGFFKLGLRGGAPMWSGFGRGEKRVPTPPSSSDGDKSGLTESSSSMKPKKELHLSKVSILKKKNLPKSNVKNIGMKMSSDFIDYIEFEENSSTPPVTPPSGSNRMIGQKMIPKQDLVTEIVDYEDDNSTVLSSEVSLSSAAQQNDDELEMTETLSQNDIGEVISSPLEADQISDEFLLFQENMVVDISGGVQYSDKEEVEEEYADILIRSPTTSDDEFIMQGPAKKFNILDITDAAESPDQDANTEPTTEPSTEPEDEDLTQSFEESEVVVIDQHVKSPEEQISTKEDFEELIDEGSRKEKLLKPDPKHVTDFHKYAATNLFSFPQKAQTTTIRPGNIIGSKLPQKISLITTPLIQNFAGRADGSKSSMEPQKLILTPTTKITTTVPSKLTSIILAHNTVRSNILSVGPKIVSSSPSITILPSKFTVPVISASAVRQLPNVKVIDKPSSSLSLTTHDNSLPRKLFEDGSVSPDNSNGESLEDKSKGDSSHTDVKLFMKNNESTGKTEVIIEHPKQIAVSEAKNEFAEKLTYSLQKQVGHLVTKEKIQKISNPVMTKATPPVIIHHTAPELKMTAQVIQEPTSHMQITATETMSTFDGSAEDKSVVISIPSPTPSQEQMLDNIALQAMENRRREFESYEDVLDMFENMQNPDTPEVVNEKKPSKSEDVPKEPVNIPMAINVANIVKQTVPQLSPLSQPTELTTNMANASQQLRTLLSLQTSANSQTSNVETTGKSTQKISINPTPPISSPVVSSRVIQQIEKQPAVLTTASTVIVPNMVKQKFVTSSPNKTSQMCRPPSTSNVTTTIENVMTNRIVPVSSEQVKPMVSPSSTPSTKSSVISNVEITKKASLTLTAMLQNQPAATATTKPSTDTITAASLLATPVSLSPTRFSAALAQAQPNAIIAAALTSSSSPSYTTTNSVITSSFKAITSTTNLLHTQLTKARTKSLDDVKELKEEIKIESSEPDGDVKQEFGNTKYIPPANRGEDSQNVLLKKLLQNTACASTQSLPPSSTSNITTLASSNDTQKSNPPTLSSLLPPVIKTEPQTSSVTTQTRPTIQRLPIRETSFVSSPVIQQSPTSVAPPVPTQQLHIDVKKCAPPSRSSSRDELLSPPTPRSSCSQDSSLQTPPLIVKKEFPSQSNGNDVKKEFLDDTSQHSEISDLGKGDVQIKEEMDVGDGNMEKTTLDKEELKKQKRRMYNQKRRQNQILNKEVNRPNKRPRKNSKLDEDYDSYIDGVLVQIKQLPPMTVSEPILMRNYGVMSIFGSGDLSKIGTKCYDSRVGDLKGTYGNALVPGFSDFYSTKPYGEDEPLPEMAPASTQRGFYDQEFPLIRFDTADDKKFDLFSREDTPDSVISSSSPEHHSPCDMSDRYIGLKLISDEEDETVCAKGRVSPDICIIKPIPIKLKPAGLFLKDAKADVDDKENVCQEMRPEKLRPGSTPTTPLKENENIKVTLTLTSSAAEDIVGVLRDLANILQIPPPTTYQIVDRTSSSAGQKLGMYRTKGKDGKEGAPIDIQSILNGAAKFCKHCDVVILNNMIRKKVSDLPFLAKDSDLLSEGDELYFCSSTCYMQFALTHRSPSISEDKAAAIIDHLSQKEKIPSKPKQFSQIGDSKPSLGPRPLSAELKDIKTENPLSFSYFDLKPGNKLSLAKTSETPKVYRNVSYKFWTPGCLQPNQKHKRLTDKEMIQMLYQMGITVSPPKVPEDTRRCMFCQVIGDGVADGPARLLNFDVDKWVHLNCALWSDGVYETVNGALMNLENAIQQSLATVCVHCGKAGATIRCFKTRCCSVYHLSCAVRDSCVFFKNKTIYCTTHVPKNDKDNELTTLSVSRRVYVNRDENRQVAAVMHHSDTNNLLRVGSLIFLNVGQLMPHQLQNFHTPNFIYPIGYKIIRFYWSMRYHNKRCRYICSIHDSAGHPEFRVLVQEASEEDVEYKDQTPKGAWNPVLDRISSIRRENKCLQMFPRFISGEDLFGLSEPAVVRVLESLPGIDTLSDYKFKYGRNPLLELPLAINPTGAARTEPRLRHQTHWKRPHTQRTTGSSRPLFGPSPMGPTTPTSLGEMACPYSKQFVHSKSSQYRKMKSEWRNNVYLARSKIQGLGLYAARDLEKHTMVIEYIGEVIRTELSECREKQYEAKNRGIYMFRLDDDRVVDATLSGGLARYINHSCNPNCVAETVEIDRDLKIIIFAKRRIQRGEELAYDYKFDIEDDQHKISCMCGAPNCRKWMN